MSSPPGTRSDDAQGNRPASVTARPKLPPPAALSSEAAEQYEKLQLQRPLKPGTGKTTSDKTENPAGVNPAARN